jgi:hypothetical protein
MKRRQSDADFARVHAECRATIQDICDVFDAEKPYVAFALASEIYKFLTTGDRITSIRKDRAFTTVDFDYSEKNLLAEYKLIVGRVYGSPPSVSFRPAFSADAPHGTKELPFVDWWNRDIIFRASASPDQSKPHFIPADAASQVPRAKRKTFVRREIITLVRNKLGAHLDRDLPEELDNLQRSEAFGCDIQVDLGDRKLTTLDGTLPMKVGPLAAMVRQIAHEVLLAFSI